jgi:hypothetical protein
MPLGDLDAEAVPRAFATPRARAGALLAAVLSEWLPLLVAPLAYAPLAVYRAGAGWHDPWWRWPLTALPFFLLLAVDLRTPRAQALPRA